MTPLLQAARYSAAAARTRALLTHLLSNGQWAEIVEAPDLASLFLLLRYTSYGASLPGPDAAQMDALQVERGLLHHLAAASYLPLTLLQGGPRRLLEAYWQRFELENLKTLLRGVQHEASPVQLQAAVIALGPHSLLPWSDLANAGSVSALVERLVGTWYGRVLEPALDQARRQGSVFPLEVALDLAYYAELLARIAGLQGEDRADAASFLGTWIDAQNLLWAYRYRLYGRLSPEEILNYTLQRNLRVDAEIVTAIALGAPLLDVVQRVWRGLLPGLDSLAALPEQEALPRLELLVQRHLYLLARRTHSGMPLRLSALLSYLFLLETEVRDLVTVVEGKSFGWSSAQIRPYLIGDRGL